MQSSISISDIKAWTTANMLKPNDNKTEHMLLTSKKNKVLPSLSTSIYVGNVEILFESVSFNFGLPLDAHLTMNTTMHLPLLELSTLNCHEASIHRFLTNTASATLVSAFSKKNYNHNLLLIGSTHDIISNL